jgi:hypothetical protein
MWDYLADPASSNCLETRGFSASPTFTPLNSLPCQRLASPCYDGGVEKDKGNGKDKADAPKPVADYWINPSLKEHKPTARGIVIRTCPC